MSENYAVYPNARGHKADERGYLRFGTVSDTPETQEMDIAGFCPAGAMAVVTEEADGWCKFYIWTITRPSMVFPGLPIWVGPFSSISEDIQESKGAKE